MRTKREQILTAVRTALTGTTGVGARIYCSRETILMDDGKFVQIGLQKT